MTAIDENLGSSPPSSEPRSPLDESSPPWERAIATVSGAVLAVCISGPLYVRQVPLSAGGPRLDDTQVWVMKVTVMIFASWSAIQCLRRSERQGAMAAIFTSTMWVLVASYLWAKLCVALDSGFWTLFRQW